jgi:hypothetical protein
VRKYKNKIECKKSDTNTNKIKVQAWIDLSKEFLETHIETLKFYAASMKI